jgi:hypothetical protein
MTRVNKKLKLPSLDAILLSAAVSPGGGSAVLNLVNSMRLFDSFEGGHLQSHILRGQNENFRFFGCQSDLRWTIPPVGAGK